jgi:hypothetical protein
MGIDPASAVNAVHIVSTHPVVVSVVAVPIAADPYKVHARRGRNHFNLWFRRSFGDNDCLILRRGRRPTFFHHHRALRRRRIHINAAADGG